MVELQMTQEEIDELRPDITEEDLEKLEDNIRKVNGVLDSMQYNEPTYKAIL